jgi:hypothetical protein
MTALERLCAIFGKRPEPVPAIDPAIAARRAEVARDYRERERRHLPREHVRAELEWLTNLQLGEVAGRGR